MIRNSPGQGGCDALGTFTAVGGIIDGDPMPRRRAAKPPVSPFQHQLGARTWFGYGGAFRASLPLIGDGALAKKKKDIERWWKSSRLSWMPIG